METQPYGEQDLLSISKKLTGFQKSLSLLEESAGRRIREDYHGCKHMSSDGYCRYGIGMSGGGIESRGKTMSGKAGS